MSNCTTKSMREVTEQIEKARVEILKSRPFLTFQQDQRNPKKKREPEGSLFLNERNKKGSLPRDPKSSFFPWGKRGVACMSRFYWFISSECKKVSVSYRSRSGFIDFLLDIFSDFQRSLLHIDSSFSSVRFISYIFIISLRQIVVKLLLLTHNKLLTIYRLSRFTILHFQMDLIRHRRILVHVPHFKYVIELRC